MGDFLISLLMWSYYRLPILISIAALVLGIIVTVNKLKQTKILGLSVIFTALSELLSSGSYYLTYFMGTIEAARFSSLKTILVLAFSLAGLFCICYYAHHNYQKKYIYYPVLILPVLGRIFNYLENITVYGLSSFYDDYFVLASRVSLFQNITSLVVFGVVFFLLFLLFYSNRKTEKLIPHYHVICFITLIWRIVYHCYYALYNLISILDSTGSIDESFLVDFMFERGYSVITFLTLSGDLIGLIFPVYLLIRVIKISRAADNGTDLLSDDAPAAPQSGEPL